MHQRWRAILRRGLMTGVLLTFAAAPALAQIEDQLSVYTGDNAVGYLQPLADALGASLNDGFYQSARIPRAGVKVGVELKLMGVMFGDDDRSFSANSEGSFQPETTAEVPTVVGDPNAVFVNGQGGATFAFPGGLDLSSFALPVPQLRVSGIAGSEGLLRWVSLDTGDSELGKVSLFGLGVRHSLSQYMASPKFDLAAGLLWQHFNVGENSAGGDLMSTSAFSVGLQASKRYGAAITVEPFAGLSLDTFAMEVDYEHEGGESLHLDFDRATTFHLTLGAGLNLKIVNLSAAYSFAEHNSFNLGVSLGTLGL